MKRKIIISIVCMFCAIMTCKAQSHQVEDLMKADFEEFYTLLKQKDFEKAVNFVSVDYLKASSFSKEQMKNLLQSNFDNWEMLPDLKVTFKEIEIQKPSKVIKKENKSFGVLEAIMNFEMSFTGYGDDEEIKTVLYIIEGLGKDRYKIDEVIKNEGNTIIKIKDKRLVAGIYNHSTQKVGFAMAEVGLIYTFEKFLPKEIIEEMKTQL